MKRLNFRVALLLVLILMPIGFNLMGVRTLHYKTTMLQNKVPESLQAANQTYANSTSLVIEVPEVSLLSDGKSSTYHNIKENTTTPEASKASSSRYINVHIDVPSIWNRQESITVKFTIELYGYMYAQLHVKFEGGEYYYTFQREFSSEKVATIFSPVGTVTLTCNIPTTTVGLKSGRMHVYGTGYYKEGGPTPYSIKSEKIRNVRAAPGVNSEYISTDYLWINEFVQRYSIEDLNDYGGLPPADNLTADVPYYYWEGLPDDGMNVPDSYRLFHPFNWDILYQAASLIDDQPSMPRITAELLVHGTYTLMIYINNNITRWTTNSDIFTLEYGWKGVCDEFAVVLISFERAMGIPARYLYGRISLTEAHAWAEVFVNGKWIHADATWNAFDNPRVYTFSYIYIRIYAQSDDQRYGNDGSATDGRLSPGDWIYSHIYDGNNSYLIEGV